MKRFCISPAPSACYQNALPGVSPAAHSAGRVCAAPTVACPPAIPIAVSGETIGPAAPALFAHYGVETVEVVRPDSD